MSAPSWPQLLGWAATASVRTLSGVHVGDEQAAFLFEGPDLWWDAAHGGSTQPYALTALLRMQVDRYDGPVAALRVDEVVHHGRRAWRAELSDGSAWVVDDETGLGLRREHDGYVHEVRELRVDQPLPPDLLAQARAAAAAAEQRQQLEQLVRESPPPTPRWHPWRWQSVQGPGLLMVDGGSVGRAPLGVPAPVDDWDGGDEAATVRFERTGWSWAVLADPPLTTVEAERVVDEILDERPSWRPADPPSPQPDLTDVPPAPGGPVPPPQPGGRVLWEGELHLHYGFYALSSEDPTGAHEIRGQAQGLLSAHDPGTVRAVAGLHTGALPLRIELHQQDPGVQPEWEEVVEASFTPYEEQVVLGAFDQFEQFALAPGTYRVRLCATGMDLGREADTVLDDEPRPEHHRLQLWPEGEERPDVLVRATSRAASSWHGRT